MAREDGGESLQSTVVRARIRECEREFGRLQVAYATETRRCSEFRDTLEAHESTMEATTASLRAQLQRAQEALQAAEARACQISMQHEDDLAQGQRFLLAQQQQIAELEHGLELLEAQGSDVVQEEELNGLDANVSASEKTIALLSNDLQRVAEYMITSSMKEVMSGPWRANLGLSREGEAQMQRVVDRHQANQNSILGAGLGRHEARSPGPQGQVRASLPGPATWLSQRQPPLLVSQRQPPLGKPSFSLDFTKVAGQAPAPISSAPHGKAAIHHDIPPLRGFTFGSYSARQAHAQAPLHQVGLHGRPRGLLQNHLSNDPALDADTEVVQLQAPQQQRRRQPRMRRSMPMPMHSSLKGPLAFADGGASGAAAWGGLQDERESTGSSIVDSIASWITGLIPESEEPPVAPTPLEAGLEDVGGTTWSSDMGRGRMGDHRADEVMLPPPTLSPLAAGLESGEIGVGVERSRAADPDPDEEWCDASPPPSPEPPELLRRRGVEPAATRSAGLEEECRLLREGLSEEIRQLAAVLAFTKDCSEPPHCSTAPPSHQQPLPLWELLRAVARGRFRQIEEVRPRTTPLFTDADDELLGWTAWHMAAACNNCILLEHLKQEMVDRGAHHRAALGQVTASSGLPPLGVALLRGHVEASRSLLLGMAPVGLCDARGNTPLMWALAGGQAEALVPLLLDLQADPNAANDSGQHIDIKSFRRKGRAVDGLLVQRHGGKSQLGNTASRAAVPGARLPASSLVAATTFQTGAVAVPGHAQVSSSTPVAQPEVEAKLIAAGPLVSDVVSFARNAQARECAQLTGEEAQLGVLSEWVTVCTCAGLHAGHEETSSTASTEQPQLSDDAPSLWENASVQALVLTAHRLLLFYTDSEESWYLSKAIPLTRLIEVALSVHSPTFIVLRVLGQPDVALRVAATVRGRLVDKFRLAVRAASDAWGGTDFSGCLRVHLEHEALLVLLDERRQRVGALVHFGGSGSMFLPYSPNLAALAGSDTCFFGVLDMEDGAKWCSHLFAVKIMAANRDEGGHRKLVWCHLPKQEESELSATVPQTAEVAEVDLAEALDVTGGNGAKFVVHCTVDKQPRILALRASSARMRKEWMSALKP